MSRPVSPSLSTPVKTYVPAWKAGDGISFDLEDVLFTAALESEELGPSSADALLPSGLETRNSAAYSEVLRRIWALIGPLS